MLLLEGSLKYTYNRLEFSQNVQKWTTIFFSVTGCCHIIMHFLNFVLLISVILLALASIVLKFNVLKNRRKSEEKKSWKMKRQYQGFTQHTIHGNWNTKAVMRMCPNISRVGFEHDWFGIYPFDFEPLLVGKRIYHSVFCLTYLFTYLFSERNQFLNFSLEVNLEYGRWSLLHLFFEAKDEAWRLPLTF